MSAPAPINPYASPVAEEPQLSAGDGAAPPLYSATAVSIATFFGSLAAGAVIMAINYARCGRPSAAWWTIGLGLLATLAFMAGASYLPDDFPALILAGVQTVAAHVVATRLQQSLIEDHLARGGKLASSWWAFGISLIVAVVILGLVLIVLLALPAEWLGEEL